MLEKSNDKIVYLSKVKTKKMLFLENNDINFKDADKNLKRNLSNIKSLIIHNNIKLLIIHNKDITYPDCLAFEDVLELHLKCKKN